MLRSNIRASLEDDCAAMEAVQAGSGDRDDAGGAKGQGAGDSRFVLHQPDFCAAPDGCGWGWVRWPR